MVGCFIGKKDVRKKTRHHDNRLSKREFRDLVYKVIEHMAGAHEQFDNFIDFLFNSVEVTSPECTGSGRGRGQK